MVYQGGGRPLFQVCLALNAITRNWREAQSPSTPCNALQLGKGCSNNTIHNSMSDGDNGAMHVEPTLPLKWPLQGRLGATEEALQAADTLLSSDCFTDLSLRHKQHQDLLKQPPLHCRRF